MAVNADEFSTRPLPQRTSMGAWDNFTHNRMRALGFQSLPEMSRVKEPGEPDYGVRVGGITDPKVVTLEPGNLILRFFSRAEARMGEWWCTLNELQLLIDHLGHTDFSSGEGDRRTILHATLAVLGSEKEFNNAMTFFSLFRVKAPFLAFFGETNAALYGAGSGFKPMLILDQGRQRPLRQLMIPCFWRDIYAGYRRTVGDLIYHTPTDLFPILKQRTPRPLGFELTGGR